MPLILGEATGVVEFGCMVLSCYAMLRYAFVYLVGFC